MYNLEETLIENPVIAALRNNDDLSKAISSNAKVVFILYGNIMTVKDICEKLKAVNKLVFIHIDMLEGLKGDFVGLEFIKKFIQPHGIITTKVNNVKYAKQLGLITIQRIFVIDSLSLETGAKNIKDASPNAVEVMPGVENKIINRLQSKVRVPVIAGGLITEKKDAMEALASGAIAVSTSASELWNM